MALRWVCELEKATRRLRTGAHIAFQWEGTDVVVTACGRDWEEEDVEWLDSDLIVSVETPQLVLRTECAAMTVEQVNDAYWKWQRGEPR